MRRWTEASASAALPYAGPSAALCSATWRRRSTKSRARARRKLTGKEEALLVATACSSPPDCCGLFLAFFG